MNVPATAARRTWKITLPVFVESALIELIDTTVTAWRVGDTIIAAAIGDQPATVSEVTGLLFAAIERGTFELIEAVDAPQAPIGKTRAHLMHVELAEHGYPTNHRV